MASVLNGTMFDGRGTVVDAVLAARGAGGVVGSDEMSRKVEAMVERLSGFGGWSDPILGVCVHCGDDCHTLGFENDIVHLSCYTKFMPSSSKELLEWCGVRGVERDEVKRLMGVLCGPLVGAGRSLGEFHSVAFHVDSDAVPLVAPRVLVSLEVIGDDYVF